MLKLLTRAEDDPPTLSNYLKGVVQKYLEKDEDKDRAKALFEHEKERIKKLAFWNDVSELSTLMPYHINPIAFLGNVINTINRKVCPIDPKYRSHFVLHSTGGVNAMTEKAIWGNAKREDGSISTSKAHKYIMRDGKVIELWPFTKRNVYATRKEDHVPYKGKGTRVYPGQMFHVELNYGLNEGSPTRKQYEVLADLYI